MARSFARHDMAVYATALASFAFSLYLVFFPIHGVAYGSLGTAMSLLLYLYFSAAVLLFGAELNAELWRNALKEGGINEEAP
jgi:membrane protein